MMHPAVLDTWAGSKMNLFNFRPSMVRSEVVQLGYLGIVEASLSLVMLNNL